MLWLAHQQLKSKSARIRRQAVEKLRSGMTSRVVPAFLKVLREDPDEAVREAAAMGLAEHRGRESLDALTAALTDAAAAVRVAAVDGLRRLGDSAAIPALEPLLRTQEPGVRARVAQALQLLGWQPADSETEAIFLVASGELDRAAILGKAAIAPLSDMLKDPAYQRRVVAINRLAEIGDAKVIRPLMSALGDRESVVRTAAANALGRLEATEAVKRLVVLLGDPEPNVRSAVVEALGLLGDPQTVQPLVETLQDPHWSVRFAALEALGRMRDVEATARMCGALRDPDREVREQACEALGAMGDARAAAALVLALLDGERVVRHAAARALQRVDPYWERLDGVQEVIPEVRSRSQDPDYGVRLAAMDILRRCGEGPAAPSHTTITTIERRKHSAEEILLDLLADPDAALRQAALECLSELDDPAPGEWWSPLTEDRDPSVRALAMVVAAKHGSGELPP